MLTNHEIARILNRDHRFGGVYPKNRLPFILVPKPSGFIINLDENYKPGSHWVAVYFPRNGMAFYFDSFGNYPPEEIENLLDRNAKNNWSWNKFRFQGDLSVLCGYYCILFLKYAPNYQKFYEKLNPCNFEFNETSIIDQINNFIH